jgi:hypothetical protein
MILAHVLIRQMDHHGPGGRVFVHLQFLVGTDGQSDGSNPFVFNQHAIMRGVDYNSVGAFLGKRLRIGNGPGLDLNSRKLRAGEIFRSVGGGRRPDDIAGLILKVFGGAVEINQMIVPAGQEYDDGSRRRMLVHGHSLMRSHMFLKDANPLVLQLQVSVLRIGHQWIGGFGRGCCPTQQKSATQKEKRFAMSTWHEKILDHEQE